MSVIAKVVMFLFVAICVAGFVVLAAFIQSNHAAVDATINDTHNSYYDAQQQVNKSVNATMQFGTVAVGGLTPLPMLVMIFAVACAFMVFLTVVKKR